MPPRARPPALILGTGITALGTLRALADAGIDVYALSADPEWERYSRWYRPLPGATPLGEATQLEGCLSSITIPEAVVFPCSDHLSRAFAALPASLKNRFRMTQAPLASLELFLDKQRFAATLEQLDIPRPHTVLNPSRNDFQTVSPELLPLYFLKPVDSQGFFRRFEQKAFTFASHEEAVAQLQRAEAAGFQVVLQERIPGPADRYIYIEGFIDHSGSIRSTFARRRLRMYPLDFGNSTAMISIALDTVSDAVASVHRLLLQSGYRGIYSAECKIDIRDGRYKLIEVNTRPWWYISCPVRCGLNVAEQAYRDALLESVPEQHTYHVGYRMINAYTDAVVMRALRRSGEVSLTGWLGEWLRSGCTLFTWQDPLPGVAWLWSRIKAQFLRSRS